MKDLKEYVVEKLKLSDITKKSLDHWVDVRNYHNINEFKEGNIILLKNGERYLLVPTTFAQKLLNIRQPGPNFLKYPLSFLSENRGGIGAMKYFYLSIESYNEFPKYKDGFVQDYEIVKVFNREMHYTDINEIKDDLANIKIF